jgi:hypothetical protein
MSAVTKFLAGGVAAAALCTAAPAAAQYYPGYGNGYANGYGNGYGYNQSPYGYNQQAGVSQCTAAVQQRLGGGYGGYGYNNSRGGRVLGVSRIEPRPNGGVTVRGVASSGRYGYGYGGQPQVDLTWRCRTDYRGYVIDVSVDRAQPNGYDNRYQSAPYNGENYEQYGYRRY